MDDIDRTLLRLLIGDARATYQELSHAVHLSANSVADRVRRLRRSGVLAGYHARLGLSALGRTLLAYTDVLLRDDVDRTRFERDLADVEQVIGAAHTTGVYDYQLHLACTGTDDLERAGTALRGIGARELHSRIVLRSISLDPARLLSPAAGS